MLRLILDLLEHVEVNFSAISGSVPIFIKPLSHCPCSWPNMSLCLALLWSGAWPSSMTLPEVSLPEPGGSIAEIAYGTKSGPFGNSEKREIGESLQLKQHLRSNGASPGWEDRRVQNRDQQWWSTRRSVRHLHKGMVSFKVLNPEEAKYAKSLERNFRYHHTHFPCADQLPQENKDLWE